VKSSYAHTLMVQVGVQTIINVGASWNEPQQAFDNSEYYRARGEEGAVLATNIGLAVTWPHFKTELARVLRFMIDHDPPYLIHCSLGQDRAGITSAVLEALAGADLPDIMNDYALTFTNYYRITPGHLLYPEVLEQLLSKLREMNYGAEVTSENLQDVIARYLIDEVGLSDSEIRLLQEKLAGESRGDAPSEPDRAEGNATAAEIGDAVAQGQGLEEVDGRLVLDDFDDGNLTSKLGLDWRSYTGDGANLVSSIRVQQDSNGSYLLLDAVGSGFVGIESALDELDLSGCDGIYIVFSTKVAASVALNLRSKDEQWPSGFRDAYVSRWVCAPNSPEMLYTPFSSLAVEAWRRERCPTCDTRADPTRGTSLQVELAEPSAELRIYEVGFYKDAAPVAPIPEEAKPGVDGYAVILETYDRVDTQIEPPVHINRDRIVDALTSLGWAEKNMFVVLDHAVTTEGVESAFEWLGDRVTEEDIVFFYVAGHGSYMKQAVHLDEVASELWESLATARKLLVVDTCMAGKFTTPAMYGEFLLPEEVADSGIIPTPALSISACQYDESAWGGIEEEGLPIIGLVMTYYLAEALRDPTLDQNGDGFTSVEEAFAGVYARTQAYMRDFVYQVPEFLAGALEHSPDLDPADYPHPELIDGFPGELILDPRYHEEAAN